MTYFPKQNYFAYDIFSVYNNLKFINNKRISKKFVYSLSKPFLNGNLTKMLTIGSVLKTSKWHYLVFYVPWSAIRKVAKNAASPENPWNPRGQCSKEFGLNACQLNIAMPQKQIPGHLMHMHPVVSLNSKEVGKICPQTSEIPTNRSSIMIDNFNNLTRCFENLSDQHYDAYPLKTAHFIRAMLS